MQFASLSCARHLARIQPVEQILLADVLLALDNYGPKLVLRVRPTSSIIHNLSTFEISVLFL